MSQLSLHANDDPKTSLTLHRHSLQQHLSAGRSHQGISGINMRDMTDINERTLLGHIYTLCFNNHLTLIVVP